MIDLSSPLASGSDNRTLTSCPVCGLDYADNGHRFVTLCVGALKRDGPHSAHMSEELSGFMNLFWHDHDQGCASVEIVSDATNGQADLYACSFACMKTLLAGLVDQLEANLKRHLQEVPAMQDNETGV
jgi:hypothetical protein